MSRAFPLSMPIVCACFVDACLISMLKIFVIHFTTTPNGVVSHDCKVLGREERKTFRFMISMKHRPILCVVMFCVWFLNTFRGKITVIMTMCSYIPLNLACRVVCRLRGYRQVPSKVESSVLLIILSPIYSLVYVVFLTGYHPVFDAQARLG